MNDKEEKEREKIIARVLDKWLATTKLCDRPKFQRRLPPMTDEQNKIYRKLREYGISREEALLTLKLK